MFISRESQQTRLQTAIVSTGKTIIRASITLSIVYDYSSSMHVQMNREDNLCSARVLQPLAKMRVMYYRILIFKQ